MVYQSAQREYSVSRLGRTKERTDRVELTNSSNERKEAKPCKSISEEIWASSSNKGRALPQSPVVVGGMGSRINLC